MVKPAAMFEEKKHKEYIQAVSSERQMLTMEHRTPTLFGWFLVLNAVVMGIISILPSRLLEEFTTGRLSSWIVPLSILFLFGGAGLFISEMLEQPVALWKTFFRFILIIAYSGLAVLWWQTMDVDGVLLSLLIVFGILLSFVIEISSLKFFAIFIFCLLDGMMLLSFVFASDVHLLSLQTFLFSSYPWVGYVISIGIALSTLFAIWAYFSQKKFLAWVLAVMSLPLLLLGIFYAGQNEWQKTFVVLTAAMLAFLLPFWDELEYRKENVRASILQMFGAFLALFVVTVILIYTVQNILIQNVSVSLSDKVYYGKLQVESVLSSATQAVTSLSLNPTITPATTVRSLYEANGNFYKVILVDTNGTVTTSYPVSGKTAESVLGTPYFTKALVSTNVYVSDMYPNFEGSGINVIAIAHRFNASGILVGFLNVNSLNDHLQTIASPANDEYFLVVDATGNWILWPQRFDFVTNKNGSSMVTETSRNGDIRQGYSLDGHLTIAAVTSETAHGWQIVLSAPLFQALSVKQTAYIAVLIFAGFSVLIIGLSVLRQRKSL